MKTIWGTGRVGLIWETERTVRIPTSEKISNTAFCVFKILFIVDLRPPDRACDDEEKASLPRRRSYGFVAQSFLLESLLGRLGKGLSLQFIRSLNWLWPCTCYSSCVYRFTNKQKINTLMLQQWHYFYFVAAWAVKTQWIAYTVKGLPRCKNLWSFTLFSSYYFPWLFCVDFSVASLYSLFYVTREFHRLLHRGWETWNLTTIYDEILSIT